MELVVSGKAYDGSSLYSMCAESDKEKDIISRFINRDNVCLQIMEQDGTIILWFRDDKSDKPNLRVVYSNDS